MNTKPTSMDLSTPAINHNPFISSTHDNTLVNIRAVLTLLQNTAEYLGGPENPLTDESAYGLHLIHDGLIQALDFELLPRTAVQRPRG